MSRVCHFTGKKTRAGNQIARKGKAKYLGGVGRKTTGTTKRKFKPNIQRVRAVIDGRVCRIQVSAKAIRMGLLEKPKARIRPGGTGGGLVSPSPGVADLPIATE